MSRMTRTEFLIHLGLVAFLVIASFLTLAARVGWTGALS